MLTQDQISKLEKLTTHKKYGKLLKAAIPNWKKFKAAKYTFGLEVRNGKFLRSKHTSGCCLIGAALYGRKQKINNSWFLEEAASQFGLKYEDVQKIELGFDSSSPGRSQASKFAFQVKEIVLNVNPTTSSKP